MISLGLKYLIRLLLKERLALENLNLQLKMSFFIIGVMVVSFNAEEAFGVIAERLNVSRRDIEAIYKRNPFLKNISQTQSDNKILIYGDLKAPPSPRRSGRSILKD
ncbi:MAG: hypothetical protein IPI79_06130 [Moraxellaceae bacterium]|nr:hypothetical protein [Moraxellaceae bacterium]